MKNLIAGLMFVATASTTPVFAVPTTYSQEPVEHKVVEIHMTTAKTMADASKRKTKSKEVPITGGATCSGAFIDDTGDILTAKHCVTGFDAFEVVTFDQKKYTAVVIATSTIHDLALIHIDRLNSEYFKLAAKITRGEHVSILGSPLGITDTLSQGTIARIDGDVFFVDCTVIPGNSGGPAFDDDHNLVGIATSMFVVLFGPAHLNTVQGNEAIWFFLTSVFAKR